MSLSLSLSLSLPLLLFFEDTNVWVSDVLALYSSTTTTIPHFTLASDLFFGLNPVKIPISMMAIPVLPGFLYLKKQKRKAIKVIGYDDKEQVQFYPS